MKQRVKADSVTPASLVTGALGIDGYDGVAPKVER